MKTPLRVIAISFLAIASLFAFGSAAGARSEKVVYFDPAYQQSVKPGRIFLSANAGPYLKKLKWTGWGTNKTVGRGRFISDCASCGEYENRAVTITLRKVIYCKAVDVHTYKFGKIHVKDSRRKRVSRFDFGTCPGPEYA
ncbi:MAG: hypothetical protein JJE13_13635, partial [Thermoleophilia bacterium]|nr:hypothetical protein [Thermoleophilia bacterium]